MVRGQKGRDYTDVNSNSHIKSLPFIIMMTVFVFLGIIVLVVFIIAKLLIGRARNRYEQRAPVIQLDWKLDHNLEYIPSSVHCVERPITPEERLLLRKTLRFSAEKVAAEQVVQVLDMEIQEGWSFNICDPECCAPRLLLLLDGDDYLFLAGRTYSHGLRLFADHDLRLAPLSRRLTVVRTRVSHIPLDLIRNGESILPKTRRTDAPMTFAAFGDFDCEFVRIEHLPDEFRSAF
jgi:hypothetical protein